MRDLIDMLRTKNVDFLVGDGKGEDTLLQYSTSDHIKIEITYHRDLRLFSYNVGGTKKDNVKRDDIIKHVNLVVYGIRHSKAIR